MLELLAVLLLIGLLAILVVPSFQHLVQSQNATRTVYRLLASVERARVLAVSEGTYAWVGFAQENAGDGAPSIVISTVLSRDGTQVFSPNASASATNRLDPARLSQVGNLVRLDNTLFADVGEPSGSGSSWESRPSVKRGPVLYRIGASTPQASRFPFQYPVGTNASAQHIFTKTVQFNPRGEAVLNGSYSYVPWLEIVLQPTHGAFPLLGRESAIQVAGLNGNIQIYRK